MLFFGDCRVIRLSTHISLTPYFVLEKQEKRKRENDECSSLNKTLELRLWVVPKWQFWTETRKREEGVIYFFLQPPASACRYVKKAVMISHDNLHRKLKGVLNDVCQCRWRFSLRSERRGSRLYSGHGPVISQGSGDGRFARIWAENLVREHEPQIGRARAKRSETSAFCSHFRLCVFIGSRLVFGVV